MSTPTRPTAVAIQRRRPTFSPRKTIDSAVTNSGATKPVADASAIGRNASPEMKNSDEPSKVAPRMKCSPRRFVCSANSGEPGIIAGVMISAKTRNLIQAISIDGSVAERYFAVTSEQPKNTVDARISAMPLNGRSARAGAFRAVDFFQAKAMERCPAWRLRREAESRQSRRSSMSNWARLYKTPNALTRQGPQTGCRYARMCAAQHFGNTAFVHETLSGIRYSIGRPRGFGPRGKALSSAAISLSPSVRSSGRGIVGSMFRGRRLSESQTRLVRA